MAHISKEAAAQILGVSVRTLLRYSQDGRIGSARVAGKTRPITVFDEGEVHALRCELERPAFHAPSVERASPPPDTLGGFLGLQARSGADAQGVERLAEYFESLVWLQTRKNEFEMASQRLLLSLREARDVSGLTAAELRRAVMSQKISSVRSSRGIRIRRSDLEAYIVGL